MSVTALLQQALAPVLHTFRLAINTIVGRAETTNARWRDFSSRRDY
jgi:hypothetical protein